MNRLTNWNSSNRIVVIYTILFIEIYLMNMTCVILKVCNLGFVEAVDTRAVESALSTLKTETLV